MRYAIAICMNDGRSNPIANGRDQAQLRTACGTQWLRDGIEGANIANVFKRTFYQMMLKFRIGASEVCSGCVLALPVSVGELATAPRSARSQC